MEVKFYNNTSDNIVANKNITLVDTKQCVLSGDNVKESPRIITEYSANLLNANYCYIAELGRYYFISPHELLSGGRVAFNTKTDLLKTCLNDIKNSTGTVTRSQRKNTNIADPLYVKGANNKIITRRLGLALQTSNTGSYLIQIGG